MMYHIICQQTIQYRLPTRLLNSQLLYFIYYMYKIIKVQIITVPSKEETEDLQIFSFFEDHRRWEHRVQVFPKDNNRQQPMRESGKVKCITTILYFFFTRETHLNNTL